MFVEIHKWTDFDKIFYFIFLMEVSVLNPLRDTVKYSALISEKYFKGEKNEKTHSSYGGISFSSDPTWDSIVLWLLSLIVIVNSIAFIICRNIYWNISPAFDTDKIPLQRAITAEDPYPEAEIQAQVAKVRRYYERGIPYYAISQIEKNDETDTQQPKSDPNSIDNIVKEWTRRDDKPYLKESITITQVAEEMGLNARLLSNYINNVKGRNFNSWINFLKVQETKVVLLADRTLPLSDIAYRMGFADLASMSRIFKQMEGMPPSVYRQRN